MKIAFFVNEFPSLSQTFVLNQITGLIDRGHDVDIFAKVARNDGKVHENVNKYNLLEHTIYPKRIPSNKITRIFKGLGYILKFIPKNHSTIIRSLNIFEYGKTAVSLNLLYEILPFLSKGPYDITHCQVGILGPGVLNLKQMGVVTGKLVVSFRGYDASKYLYSNPGIYDELFRQADLFFPICRYFKQRLIKEGCDEKKIMVHRSGVDLTKFKYSERNRLKGGSTKLLTIARLVEKKGVAYAINAVARLVASGRRIKYYVVGGDGGLRGDLEKLIEDLDLSAHVHLLGWMNQEEVIRFLNSAHILVAPSVTASNGDKEGIPNVIKEAMAMGLPVISTNHSGIPELVEDGVSGFLVPERDVDALTDRMAYLIDHSERWSEMGRKGRKMVIEHYDIDKLNDKLLDIYQRLVN